jgi:hypothetical protein
MGAKPLPDGISIRRVDPAKDLPQIRALFAAGNRQYFDQIPDDVPGGRGAMILKWEEEIQHALASDLGTELSSTYLASPRCGFWCVVDESKETTGGDDSAVLGMVGADGHYPGNTQSATPVLELRRLTHPVMAPAVRLYESLGYTLVADRTEEEGGYTYEKQLHKLKPGLAARL